MKWPHWFHDWRDFTEWDPSISALIVKKMTVGQRCVMCGKLRRVVIFHADDRNIDAARPPAPH